MRGGRDPLEDWRKRRREKEMETCGVGKKRGES